jgi:putative nucleotidyltransferase with HDIG domain
MSSAPTLREQDLLAETLQRERKPFCARDRVAEGVITGAFVAATLALLLADPPGAFELAPALACIGVLALATRVPFHVASGFTIPTQLAFVPLLFIVPPAAVPLAVVLALAAGRLPQVLLGRTRASRLLHCIGNSWFSIGPAAVFASSGTAPARAGAGLLVLALAAQFAGDFVASTVRERIESGASIREQAREGWVYAVDAALSPVALAVAYEVDRRPALLLGLVPMLGVLAGFARERRARLESIVELKNAYHGTALVLGDVVEADDAYTGEHCKSVVRITLAVADKLDLDAERRRNLEFGALLHDVGKVAIPKEIINKPGRLDPDEWQLIKTHTIEGQRMLERVGGFMRAVGLIVRSHHERWDGGGYPDGLAGETNPVESRIIACCDAWNAMRTDRSYRAAIAHEHAVEELVACAGTQFDPSIVAALLAVVAPGHASNSVKALIDAVDARAIRAVHRKPAARRGRKARGLAEVAR